MFDDFSQVWVGDFEYESPSSESQKARSVSLKRYPDQKRCFPRGHTVSLPVPDC